MKFLLKLLPIVFIFFMTCEKKNKAATPDNTATEAQSQEIINLEKENKELEENKQSIEEKSKELEGLLEDLN